MSNIDISMDENIVKYVYERIDNKDINLVDKVNEIVMFVLNEENIDVEKVSICISKEDEIGIRKLNKEYRNIDKSTDVLSFPIFEKNELNSMSKEMDKNKVIKELELGDIILCMEIIEKQSKEYETGLLRETLYMITHGVCHLVGYDHIDPNDKIIMRALEKKVLSAVGVEQ